MNSTARGHVLVVDDDAGVRRFFADTLQLAGYATAEAASLAEAAAALERSDPEIICVLLDARLPDGHGVDLLRRVRSDFGAETLPIIVVTGDDSPSSEVEGLEAGATDFLVKPVRPEALVARVGAHLRDRAAWLAMLDAAAAGGPASATFDTDRRALDEIIDAGAFHPVFQPIVDLRDGAMAGYEALTRFDDGTSPELRFAEATRLGRSAELELATLASAIESARNLPGDSYVSLNVTPGLLRPGPGLAPLLESASCQVVLEITEREAIDDYDVVRSALSGFEPTVQLSIDDAGAGFASLRHVVMLQPDFVKLDRTWVSGIHLEPTKQAMVAGLVHFADATGCVLVAEGIEADAESDMLVDLGVRYGQGYLLGRPEPVR